MKEGRREWQGKSLNDVDIRDDFMFSYIMRDPELCLGLRIWMTGKRYTISKCKRLNKLRCHSARGCIRRISTSTNWSEGNITMNCGRAT